MATTSSRLLSLLSLLGARPNWSGHDLCGRLGVSSRTLRRDVESLRELGYPVQAIKGPNGGYRLGAGSKLPRSCWTTSRPLPSLLPCRPRRPACPASTMLSPAP